MFCCRKGFVVVLQKRYELCFWDLAVHESSFHMCILIVAIETTTAAD